ncbi:single-stranded DNA-binding protein [Algoriphagus antarcticus]|uniref:Single-stranded DNA-binding protein n=1 Tax=Algoriphagus antarcticus TaxID=238540 RepID=A0A3E0DYE2_9BACT|nr:single-stranded DNA-binding protein [Algoriphagus antarcticus]REG87101.1 single-strand binding protein [Algoriphagus antarcticus]
MAGVNKVILLGNLGADPEVKYLEGDNVVAKLRLATTESYKDKTGNRVEQTEWHDLEIWGALAKVAEQYLRKGSQLYAEGKIKTDSWQDEQGQNRYRTKIRVLSFTMLGGKPDGNDNQASPQQSTQQRPASAAPTSAPKAQEMVSDTEDDDLPF